MNTVSDIKSVSYLKSHAADMLNRVNETRRPIVITRNGEATAVLQDPDSYDRMRNAIGILKLIAQGEEEIRRGRTKTQEEVFRRIGTLLATKKP